MSELSITITATHGERSVTVATHVPLPQDVMSSTRADAIVKTLSASTASVAQLLTDPPRAYRDEKESSS